MISNDEYIYCIDPDSDTPIMILDGGIGEDDAVNGAIFAKELYTLDSLGKKRVQIIINSTGGAVIDAMSIYTAIRETKMQVDTFCAGVALSSAAIIFLSGKERVMADYSKLMIHNPYGTGNIDDKALQEMKDSIIKMIAKDNGNDEIVASMMEQETWINAKDALTCGFATGIKENSDKKLELINDKKNLSVLDEAKRIYNLSSLIMNKFIYELPKKDNKITNEMESNLREELKNFQKKYEEIMNSKNLSIKNSKEDDEEDEDDEDAEERREDYESNSETMDKSEMEDCRNEVEGIEPESISADDEDAEEVMDDEEDVEKLKNELESLKNELKAYKAEKVKSETMAKAKAINDMLNEFVRIGKLTNDVEIINSWRKMAENDFETVKKTLGAIKPSKKANKILDKIPETSKQGNHKDFSKEKRIAEEVVNMFKRTSK